jgi:hypothetical protein
VPLARIACTAPWDCACVADVARPDPIDDCIRDTADACIGPLGASLGPSLASGRVRVDEAVLTECARRIEASFATCSTSKPDLRAYCLGILVEAIPLGEECVWSEGLCAGGAGSCIGGVCAALPAAGASCADFGVCAAGSACRDGLCVEPSGIAGPCEVDSHCEEDLTCTGTVCASALAGIGERCTETGGCVAGARCESEVCAVAEAGAACESDADCPSHGGCASRAGSICREKVGEGEACESSRDCLLGLFCDLEVGGVCAEVRGVGAPCSGDACAPGTYCARDTGTPICTAVGGEGAPCDPFASSGTDSCIEGLSCVGGLCGATPAEGEPCAPDQECAPGLACRTDPVTSERRCLMPGTEGETCGSFGDRSECAEGLFCDGGTNLCTRRRAAGESCSLWMYECQPGLDCIHDDASGAATCSVIPGEGSPCSSACEDGLSCRYGLFGGACTPAVCNDIPFRGGRER